MGTGWELSPWFVYGQGIKLYDDVHDDDVTLVSQKDKYIGGNCAD